MLTALYAIAAMIPMATLTGALTGGIEGKRKFGVINAIQTPLLVLGQVAPLVTLRFGADAGLAVIGIAITRLMLLVAVTVACMNYFPWGLLRPSGFRRAARQVIAFSRWIAVSNLINPFLVSADRLALGTLASISSMGIYTIPYNLITRMWLLPSALTRSLFPEFGSRRSTDQHGWELCLRSARYLALPLFLVAVPVFALGPEAMQFWLGKRIGAPTGGLLQIMTLGVLANSLGQVYATFLQGSGRPAITARLHVLELLVYLPALALLVGRFGMTGAACAWSVRMLADTTLLYRASTGTLEIDRSRSSEWRLHRAVLLGAAAIGCSYAVSAVLAQVWAKALAGALITSCLAVLFWRFGLDELERARMGRATRGVVARRLGEV